MQESGLYAVMIAPRRRRELRVAFAMRDMARNWRGWIGALALGCALAGWTQTQTSGAVQDSVTVQGRVVDDSGKGAAMAGVRVLSANGISVCVTQTDVEGRFSCTKLDAGHYTVTATRMPDMSVAANVEATRPDATVQVTLKLLPAVKAAARTDANQKAGATAEAMQFADDPNFTVAGVTDWTAAGGHGSDFSLRTSEALTRETLRMQGAQPGGLGLGDAAKMAESKARENALKAAVAAKPGSYEANYQLGKFYLDAGRYAEAIPLLQAAQRSQPSNAEAVTALAEAFLHGGELMRAKETVQALMATHGTAEAHRLAGEIDEASGDPLAAVRELESAVRLDPSEQNYFAWGSELLYHRAVWQAEQVFAQGVRLYPRSSRMMTALGGALFAGALYDEAASRLCAAADLEPNNPEPYIFMGKIEIAAPNPLPCVEQKLAWFAEHHPENGLANYYDAMALWKKRESASSAETVRKVEARLTQAVNADPKCADAYLQLGIVKASQREYSQATTYYSRAIDVNPELSDAYYRLGVAYDRLGEPEKAEQEFALHDAIKKRQAAAVEQQRRAVKQFLVMPDQQTTQPETH